MDFKLTVMKKISNTEFGAAEAVNMAGADGIFEAQALPFAKTACNAHIRSWVEGSGMTMRTQKDWVKNMKTKAMEKTVMVQNGSSPETYVFVLEQL